MCKLIKDFSIKVILGIGTGAGMIIGKTIIQNAKLNKDIKKIRENLKQEIKEEVMNELNIRHCGNCGNDLATAEIIEEA